MWSNLSTTVTLDTEESGRFGEVSVGAKHDTDIFMGFNSFVLKKVLRVTCKYVTQSKYINKRETKQNRDQRRAVRMKFRDHVQKIMKFYRHRSTVID